MARTPLTKAKKTILLVLALMALISSVVLSIAVFTDRVNSTTTIQMATFDDDGYSIERTAPEGYVTAGETLEVTLKESNDKSENITSQITMTVSWDSPVPNVYPWGNSSTGNAVIKLGDTVITYTVNADKTITFTLPETALKAGSDVTSQLTFQIPADLPTTGKLIFNFDQIELGYAGWSADYDDTKLDDLDFSVDVAWNISKNPTTTTGKTNLDVIAILKDTDQDGKYELEIIKNGADNNTNKGQMADWTGKDKTPWANYPIEGLTIDNGVTTIGDYAFAGETGITSVDIPDTITHIGTSAFDGSGLTGELTIPASVQEIESLGFGNLPDVNVITFEHGANDTLTLPDNESAGKEKTGAFYVPTYVATTINTSSADIEYEYRWHNDNRKPIPILAAQDTWYNGTTDEATITTIQFLDYYEPGTVAESWDASAAQDGSVIAYVEGTKLILAGNGYGCIFANADSSYAFSSVYNIATIENASLLNMSNVTTTYRMFYYCTYLSSLDVSTWDVGNVENAEGMFHACIDLTSLIVDDWTVSSMKYMGSMFAYCTGLTSLDVSDWVVDAALDMGAMFANCSVLTSLDVDEWNVTNLQSATNMFSGCTSLATLDVSSWSPVNLQDASGMFRSCSSLKVIDVSGWRPGVLESTFRMFENCDIVEVVDISGWPMSTVTDTEKMFNSCDSIKQLTLPATLTNFGSKFAADCTSLTTISFLEPADTEISFPTSGSSTGAFYVSDYLKTTFSFNGNTDAEGYDWVTDNRMKIGITNATLTYDDVMVGESVDPVLAIDPSNADDYQIVKYEVISGGEYAEVDEDTGVVTGLAKGEATIRVTIIDANGTTVTADGTVNVIQPVPILAANQTWFDPATEITFEYNDSTYTYLRRYIDYITIKDSYTPTGTEMVSWDASAAQDRSVKAYIKEDSEGLWELILAGNGYGKIYANADSSLVFSHSSYDDDYPSDLFWNVEAISGLELLDTSNATTMKAMFAGIDGMTSLDLSLSTLNTEKVTDMSDMFQDCNYIENLDVSGLDTGNVTNMSGMFENCFYVTKLNLSNFDTAKVTDMSYMFNGCFYLADLTVSSFNTSNVLDMSYMFCSCYRLPNLSLSNFNTAKVQTMGSMFAGCQIFTELDLSSFNTANVTDMSYMLSRCTALTDLNISSFDTSNVTDMHGMFLLCEAMEVLDLSHFVTNQVTDMSYMFRGDAALTTIYATWRFNTDAVTNSDSMFKETSSLVGGADTVWSSSYITKSRAIVDGGTSNPGYFTNNVFLSYEDIEVGETTSPTLTIRSAIADTSSSKTYSIVPGGDYATVDASTGVVTGKANGTATVRVSISATNGDTLTADAVVNITTLLPVLASDSDWYTQGGTSISQTSITSITLVDEIDSATKTAAGDNYWDASDGQIGTVTAYAVDDGSGNSTYALTIAGNGYGSIYANEDSSYAFSNSMSTKRFSNLTSITGLDLLDTSNVTDMDSMFYSCQKLTSLDVSTFDTSKVETTADMFYYCKALETLDISSKEVTMNGRTFDSWDTELLEDTSCMFQFCSKLPSLDISHFDTQNVTTMAEMFNNCNALTSLVLSSKSVTMNGRTFDSWDTGAVTTMDSMFSVCSVLPSLDISHFDTSSVGDMQYMFSSNPALATLDISTESVTMNGRTFNSWDTGNVLYMNCMFHTCKALPSLDLSHFDTSKVTTMTDMFSHCEGAASLDLSTESVTMNGRTFHSWDTGAVTNMYGMFNCCHSLTSLNVSHFDTGAVTNMGSMFYYNNLLTSLDISPQSLTLNGRTFTSWDTGAVTSMTSMFASCSLITTLDLSHFDTAQVTNMSMMFRWCVKLYTLDISNFNTSQVTDMGQMFSTCRVLPSLDVSHFDTSNVTNMYQMFEGCYDVTSIKFSSTFKTDKVTDMGAMFWDCWELTELDLSSFSTASITSSDGLAAFAYNSSSLTTIILNENFVTDASLLPVAGFEPYGMFYTASYIATTTLVNPTAAMQSYDWAEDNRTITVKTT